jgi:hypothetical protein
VRERLHPHLITREIREPSARAVAPFRTENEIFAEALVNDPQRGSQDRWRALSERSLELRATLLPDPVNKKRRAMSILSPKRASHVATILTARPRQQA